MVFIPFGEFPLPCRSTVRTVTGFPSFVFFCMYSTAPFTMFSLVILYRSLTLHPISVWKARCPSVSPAVGGRKVCIENPVPFFKVDINRSSVFAFPLSETCQTVCWWSACCRSTTGRMCVFLKKQSIRVFFPRGCGVLFFRMVS